MHDQHDKPAVTSRRELREAAEAPRRQARRTRDAAPTKHRWVPRAAVLGTLAAATIAVPISAGAQNSTNHSPSGADFAGNGSGPSALDVVTKAPAAPAISASVAAPAIPARDVAASRSLERDPLPGCDPSVEVTSENGNLTGHELCDLWQAGESLRPDAAVALSALNEAFRAEFGRDVCLVSSYRTVSSQASLRSTRGGLAAAPGKSMHGWGLAIDLCSQETGSKKVYAWLNENGPVYGWANPSWAKRGGGGSFEPWHFEYTKGVIEVGGDYSLNSKTGRLSRSSSDDSSVTEASSDD